MKKLSILFALPAGLATSPALAASGPFFSLQNTNFVVSIAFVLFVGILIYAGVPKKLAGLLDARAAQIKSDLDEARALREEAKTILASYERKQREVAEQTNRIIATAKEDAMAAAAQAKYDMKAAIARRLQGAEEQIASAEAAAIKQVRERAVAVAIAAACAASRAVSRAVSRSAADAARRAILNPRCQPWPLSPEKYNSWRSITFNFDPRDY